MDDMTIILCTSVQQYCLRMSGVWLLVRSSGGGGGGGDDDDYYHIVSTSAARRER